MHVVVPNGRVGRGRRRGYVRAMGRRCLGLEPREVVGTKHVEIVLHLESALLAVESKRVQVEDGRCRGRARSRSTRHQFLVLLRRRRRLRVRRVHLGRTDSFRFRQQCHDVPVMLSAASSHAIATTTTAATCTTTQMLVHLNQTVVAYCIDFVHHSVLRRFLNVEWFRY